MPKCRSLQLNITCGCPICPYHETALILMKLFEMSGAWPWMAMLLYQFNRTGQLFFQCAGVLITNQHVITASHCVRTGADL